jgi:ketosteroid isomerase-like protein
MTTTLWRFAPGLAILLAGCATAPHSDPAAPHLEVQAQVRQRLAEVMDACEEKDFERLDSYHLYGPKFTKFSTEGAGRLETPAARQGEHDGPTAAKGLKMRADALKIDVFDNVAIATFILDYSFDTPNGPVEKRAQTTMAFVSDHGVWKIAHEHLSPFKPNP